MILPHNKKLWLLSLHLAVIILVYRKIRFPTNRFRFQALTVKLEMMSNLFFFFSSLTKEGITMRFYIALLFFHPSSSDTEKITNTNNNNNILVYFCTFFFSFFIMIVSLQDSDREWRTKETRPGKPTMPVCDLFYKDMHGIYVFINIFPRLVVYFTLP